MSSTGADNDTIPVAELRNVSRSFAGFPALDGVSLRIDRGEILGLIGRSGAGKSTLIRCLNGLERPDSGEIFIEGQPITGLEERALLPFRRRIGMIFQHFNLLSAKTVLDNVALPLKIAGVPAAAREARARALLDLVGLADKHARYPAELSGGQKQRIGIARALATEPKLLLSDEATSALDPETTQSILELLKRINADLGLTVLLITHEMEVVKAVTSDVAVIDHGRIVERGHTFDVFTHPKHETTRAMLSGLPGSKLPDAVSRALKPQAAAGDRAVVRLTFFGAAAERPLISQLIKSVGAEVNIIAGTIDEIGGRPYGSLVVAYGADAETAGRAERFFTENGLVTEVLGYVA